MSFSQKQGLPGEFSDLLDKEKFAKNLEYLSVRTKYSLFTDTLSTAAGLLFLLMGGYAWMDRVVGGWSQNSLLQSLYYFLFLGVIATLMSLPFSYYSTFVIEERFGFNRSTFSTFLADNIKGWVLAILLGGPILTAIIYFYEKFGTNSWLLAWGFVAVIQIVLSFLAPVLLMPLFNKFDPLPEGDLKSAIEAYAKKESLSIQGIFSMDGSKRSSKANAFFTGFGKFRRIVLFDTLIEKFSQNELVAVLAHEVGHLKLGHIWKQILLSLGLSFFLFKAVFWVMMNEQISATMGFAHHSFHSGATAAMLLFGPLSLVLSVLGNWISRKFEFQADAFAKATCGDGLALVNALKKLSVDHLSNLAPHPWKIWLEYSHPPVIERVRALRGN